MTPSGRLLVPGRPTGTATWRRHVAGLAAGLPAGASGVALAFTLPEGAWVDVDTLAENTLAGMRDTAVLAPRFAGLDAVLATKAHGGEPSAAITLAPASALRRRRPPGPVELTVTAGAVPRSGDRDAKRVWRERIAAAWGDRPVLTGEVWADVALGVRGSLLGPLEVVVDALEPVLGRDPRGRDWQEFFPNDHRIGWLRVTRRRTTGVALRLGPVRRSHS